MSLKIIMFQKYNILMDDGSKIEVPKIFVIWDTEKSENLIILMTNVELWIT